MKVSMPGFLYALMALILPTHAATPETYGLANGLTVSLRPLSAATDVTVLMLFHVGEMHDPEGASGLGHFVEHVYVTAAAGEAKARSAEELIQRYPKGWNAQTGWDYTVVANVVSASDLNVELQDAAARMKSLKIDQADIDRERPRILAELHNMYSGIPLLAVRNMARASLRPLPKGHRKGGSSQHVREIDREQVIQHWQRYYKPRSAHLVVAGKFDRKEARTWIDDMFSDIPSGEAPPAGVKPSRPTFGLTEIEVQPLQKTAGGAVCLAFAAPPPDHQLYPAFLVLAANLMASGSTIAGPESPFPASFAALDAPEAAFVIQTTGGDTVEEVLNRLRMYVDETTSASAESLSAAAMNMFGFLLGLQELPDEAIAGNTYGVAFSIARCAQLGIDFKKLRGAITALTDDELRRAADEFLADKRTVQIVAKVGSK